VGGKSWDRTRISNEFSYLQEKFVQRDFYELERGKWKGGEGHTRSEKKKMMTFQGRGAGKAAKKSVIWFLGKKEIKIYQPYGKRSGRGEKEVLPRSIPTKRGRWHVEFGKFLLVHNLGIPNHY